jgi:hypothetical protein
MSTLKYRAPSPFDNSIKKSFDQLSDNDFTPAGKTQNSKHIFTSKSILIL